MFTQAQIEYIQKQYARGLNADAISNKLTEAGWEKDDIKDGLDEVARLAMQSNNPVVQSPPPANPLEQTQPSPNTVEQPLSTPNPAVQPQPTILPEIKENVEVNNESIAQADTAVYTPTVSVNQVAVETPKIEVPPVATITAIPPSDYNNIQSKPQSKSILKIIILIIISLLVLLGIAFAYYKFFYLPSINEVITLNPNATTTEEVIILDATSSEDVIATQGEYTLPTEAEGGDTLPSTDLNEENLDNSGVNSEFAPDVEVPMN